MNVRIIKKPDYLRSGIKKYSVQKKYAFWPFWIEHGIYTEAATAGQVADDLLNPIYKEFK